MGHPSLISLQWHILSGLGNLEEAPRERDREEGARSKEEGDRRSLSLSLPPLSLSVCLFPSSFSV